MKSTGLCGIFCLLVMFGTLGARADAPETGDVALISPQEAEKLNFSDDELAHYLARQWSGQGEGDLYYAGKTIAANGPRILFRAPSPTTRESIPTITTRSPLDLHIIFQETENPVNMASLEVVARKGLFSRKLTSRLKPYVKDTTISAKGITIPNGKFLIQVTIADKEGAVTRATYLLKVEKET